MSIQAWSANLGYSVGDIVAPVSGSASGLVFICTTAGTSDYDEPIWSTSIGVTVNDNTVVWTAISSVAPDLQSINPSAVIELFELELNTTQHGVNTTYRFHAGTNLSDNGNVVFGGYDYVRFPIEAEGFEYTGNDQLPRPKLRCSNILGTITALLLSLPSGIEGAKVTRRRTLAKFLDGVNFPGGVNPWNTQDPLAEWPREIYFIDRRSAENRQIVEFELAAAFDLAGVRAPKRQCINLCQWVYRSAECSYVGTNYFDQNDQPVVSSTEDVCGKRLSSCKARFGANNTLPFGSFPGVGTYFA